MTICLRTFFIVRNIEGELSPREQARIKSSGQIRTRFTEVTLCHGMRDCATT
jgi:hypothetical protein